MTVEKSLEPKKMRITISVGQYNVVLSKNAAALGAAITYDFKKLPLGQIDEPVTK